MPSDDTSADFPSGAPSDSPGGLPKTWDPGAAESLIYQAWVDAGYFTADAASGKPPYSIVLPPPNVTGSLHMGHALDHTLMDALTRRKRMQGYEVLWLPGMDHAGIATQTLVERRLAAEGVRSGGAGARGVHREGLGVETCLRWDHR